MLTQSIFDREDYAMQYSHYRKMPINIFYEYINLILKKISPNGINILDIGCGTGQFSLLFSELFAKECNVYALDKSAEMISKLTSECQKKSINNIKIINQDIIDYKTDIKFDLVFSSEMIHLIDDCNSFFRKVYSILSDTGVFAIRTSTHQQLFERSWYKYFPGSLTIDINRHKSLYLILSALSDAHFDAEVHSIDETEIIEKTQYLSMFNNKCFSTLHLIPESTYPTYFNNLKNSLKDLKYVQKDYKMTLYLAQKRGI